MTLFYIILNQGCHLFLKVNFQGLSRVYFQIFQGTGAQVETFKEAVTEP